MIGVLIKAPGPLGLPEALTVAASAVAGTLAHSTCTVIFGTKHLTGNLQPVKEGGF